MAFASRALTETERCYAQIEKEALATTWACEKFADYLLGQHFQIETDHKPLIPLLSTKHLDRMPPHVLRFRLRLAWFQYTILHVPGKMLYTADTLSRAPVSEAGKISRHSGEEVEAFLEATTAALPASRSRLEEYRRAQEQDAICAQVKEYCRTGWQGKQALQPDLVPFWTARAFLTLHDNLLLHGQRIVVPLALRKETMEKIHEGHQGIECCWMRTRISVWWPGVMTDIKQMVENCTTCAREANQRKEPMMTSLLPDYPWQVVRTDLFELKGDHYLLVVDCFSRYPEVTQMKSTTSTAIVKTLKSIFSRHGILEIVRSDNGPQYASQEFTHFTELYGF